MYDNSEQTTTEKLPLPLPTDFLTGVEVNS
jgi:hypothetical protein